MVSNTAPSSTESPLPTLIDATLPSTPALMAFSIFMASRVTTVSEAFTSCPTDTWMSRTTPGSGALTGLPPAAALAAGLAITFSPEAVRGAFRCGYFDGGGGFLLEFHLIGGPVYFDFGDAMVDVADAHFVNVTVDFILVFFHCLDFSMGLKTVYRFLLPAGHLAQRVDMRAPR